MLTWRTLAFGLVCGPCCLLVALPPRPASAAEEPTARNVSASGLSIAVADFSGQDKEMGRFLADTLLTDLAQSERLHMVERAEIGKALTELKLQSTGLTEPQDVKKVGKLLGADRLIVGSFLFRDNQLILNARLLDVRTGRVSPGGAANVSGSRENVLPLVHQLARSFHRRVTGSDLLAENPRPAMPPLDNPPPTVPDLPAVMPDRTPDNTPSPGTDGYNVRQPDSNTDNPSSSDFSAPANSAVNSSALNSPAFASALKSVPANSIISEGRLASLMSQLGSGSRFFTPGRAAQPVSRLRALIALVRAAVPSASRTVCGPRALSAVLPDADLVPAWAGSYVLAGIQQGLWPAHVPLQPNASATGGFLHGIASRIIPSPYIAKKSSSRAVGHRVPNVVVQARISLGMPVPPAPIEDRERSPAPVQINSIYTGLLVEARDLPAERTMNARILDRDGQLVYPDPGHVPDIDYIEDHGMADFYHEPRDMKRVGEHPLVVRAVGVSGDDIIVNAETARRIRNANRRDGFLTRWRVGILLDEGR